MPTGNLDPFDVIVIPSWPEILPSLHLIEDSAAQLFQTLPSTSFLSSEPGLSLTDFTHHHDLGLLWIAIVPQPSSSSPASTPPKPAAPSILPDIAAPATPSTPSTSSSSSSSSDPHTANLTTIPNYPTHHAVGFLAAHPVESYLHIEEVDVSATHQGRGVAGKLMRAAEAEARRRGQRGVSLVTSKLTPWSYDWYLRLGFCAVPEKQAARGLVAILEGERMNWDERREWADSRVIMVREF